MECYVYIRISGPSFDPVAFRQSLPSAEGGEVIFSRAPGNSGDAIGWKCVPVHVAEDEFIDQVVERLVTRLRPILDCARGSYHGKISIQTVYRYVADAGPKGLYLGPQLIALLGALEAEFDYDVY